MRRSAVPSLALGLLATAAAASEGPWATHPEVQARLISPYTAAPRDGALALGVELVLKPHWHAYWKHSGDAGFPPALVVKTPALQGADLLFPAPRRFELAGGLVAFGYEGGVIYPVRTRIAGATGAVIGVQASLDYVVCAEECVPYRDELTLEQPLDATSLVANVNSTPIRLLDGVSVDSDVVDTATSARLTQAVAQLPLEAVSTGVVARAHFVRDKDDSLLLEMTLPGVAPAGGETQLFLEPNDLFQPGTPRAQAVPEGLRFRVPMSPRRVLESNFPPTELAWTATGLRQQRAIAGSGSSGGGSVPPTGEPGENLPAPSPSGRQTPQISAANLGDSPFALEGRVRAGVDRVNGRPWWLWVLLALGASLLLWRLLQPRTKNGPAPGPRTAH